MSIVTPPLESAPATDLRAQPGRNSFLIALLFAVVSIVVRSRHLDWGLPDLEDEAFPMKKAFEMCGWGTGDLRIDPNTAGWPSLSFYVHMIVQHLQYGLGRLSGTFADRGDFFLQQATWTPVAVWARGIGTFAVSVVVFAGVRLGSRLAGQVGGLLAGMVLLTSPLLTRYAHLITPDVLLVMFCALALKALVKVYERGRLLDYMLAGLWIGLGVSTKYTPVLLLPCLYLAHLLGRRKNRKIPARLGLADGRIWLGAATCLGIFILTSPFVLADLDVLTRDLDYQTTHMVEGHLGHAAQGPGLVFYVRDVLGPGLGWPAFLLGVTGLMVAAFRRGGPWWVILATFLIFYLPLAMLQTRFERYMMPALLPLALGTAGWWVVIEPWLRLKGRAVSIAAVVVLVATLAIRPGLATSRFLTKQGLPGTQQLAKQWILSQQSGLGPYLAMEVYTPSLPRSRHISLRKNDPAFGHLSPEQQRRWLDFDPVKIVYLPFYSTRQGASDFYYDLRHFLGFDFVVTSSAVRGRYEKDPVRFAKQVEFYGDLDAQLPDVQVFAPEGVRRGPEIRIYTVDDAVRHRLATVKPLLSQDEFRAAAGKVVGSHFQVFIKTVAEDAYERGFFGIAATYFQPLYETTAPAEREQYLRPYALALLNSERWQQVEPLLQHWSKISTPDPEPRAYLGMAKTHLGNVEDAIADLKSALLLAGDAPQYSELVLLVQRVLGELETRGPYE